MHLRELVVQSRVSDRCEMEDHAEFFVPELVVPIKRRQVLGYEIAAIARKVLEIAGTKIIDHREPRLGKSLLQGEREIGADKTGATGDEKTGTKVSRRHRNFVAR